MEGPGGHEIGGTRDELVRSAFGRWIRQHREMLGISQAGFLQRLEKRGLRVSQSALSRWETGEAAPPLEAIPLLTDCLGVSLSSVEEILSRASRAADTVDLTGRSVDDLRAEGERAAFSANFHRALALYEAALDRLLLEDGAPDPLEEARILFPIAWAHYNLWHLELARDTLRRLAGLPGLPSRIALRRQLLRVALEHRYGDDETASILADDARKRLDQLEGEDRAWACHALGYFYYSTERYAEAIPLLAEATAAWNTAEEPAEATRARAFQGYCMASVESLAEGEPLLRTALREAEEGRFRDVLLQVQRLLGRALAEAGRIADGLPLLEDALAAARMALLPEEEFLGGYHAWRFLEGRAREQMARRLRRLLPRVHPLLPEARRFREALAAGRDGRKEDDR